MAIFSLGVWTVIKAGLGVLIKPLTSLGRSWIKHQSDKRKLEADLEHASIESSTTIALALLGNWMTRIPIVVLLLSIDIHIAAVFIDSTWPSNYINPLALPEIYNNVMLTAVIGQVGYGAFRGGYKIIKGKTI